MDPTASYLYRIGPIGLVPACSQIWILPWGCLTALRSSLLCMPPVWSSNRFPKFDRFCLVWCLVPSIHFLAEKAIVGYSHSSLCFLSIRNDQLFSINLMGFLAEPFLSFTCCCQLSYCTRSLNLIFPIGPKRHLVSMRTQDTLLITEYINYATLETWKVFTSLMVFQATL